MKQIFTLLFLLVFTNSFAQLGRDSVLSGKDSVITTKPKPLQRDTTLQRVTAPIADTSAIVISMPDTTAIKKDTVMSTIHREVPLKQYQPYHVSLQKNPFFNFFGKPMIQTVVKRSDTGKDGLFYLLTGMILFFAVIRFIFSKYISNLFAVFFRVSLKQKQIREQLQQAPLPSLLLNSFFMITGGVYIAFLLPYLKFTITIDVWLLIIYCAAALAIVYTVKLIVLKFMGWVFNIKEATDTYIFVVFLVNKLLSIFLLPFLVLMAFSKPDVTTALITASLIMVGILYAYRYIISFAPIRKEIKVSQFHFFIYLCAFEIIPLLLIYKLLLTYLQRGI